MNVYIFRNRQQMTEFREWLVANIGRRYRIIRYTQPPFRIVRSLRKRPFHSHVTCTAHARARAVGGSQSGWAQCNMSHACFQRTRIFRKSWKRRRLRKHFGTRFRRYRSQNYAARNNFGAMVTRRQAISVVFDSAADMVLCKMRWHDMHETS